MLKQLFTQHLSAANICRICSIINKKCEDIMLKKLILEEVSKAINAAVSDKKLGAMTKEDCYKLVTETPKNLEFGDFAVNVSSLARNAKLAPPVIANTIKEYIKLDDVQINTVAGFINFKLGAPFLANVLFEILSRSENYGKRELKKEKILLEYVSANPTGPFHIGHGRWAAMGSALANILKYAGYDVYQEFYVNDAGSQIDNMARSIYLRIRQQNGVKVDFPADEEEIKKYYPGEYLIPVAQAVCEKYADFYERNSKIEDYDSLSAEDKKLLKDFGKKYMLGLQKQLLAKLNVEFDNYFSETSLYEKNLVKETLERMTKKGLTYESEGALWFKSTEFGDEKDRVLIKHDGKFTYLSPDIAYHINKLERGYDKLINIWGADHHGYICRMKAALTGLGYSAEALEVLLGQLVNLKIDGEAVRMGKRKKMITLEELVDEVGTDATRYWMTCRDINTTLDFDVELAKSKCDENPVFYVQYAHARACSILRNACGKSIDTVDKTVKAPFITENDISSYRSLLQVAKNEAFAPICEADEASYEATKRLLLKLEEFKSLIDSAAEARAPYMLCKYLQELAAQFHSFYNVSRVISEDKELTKARLAVVLAFKTVLASGLGLLGISAPERM